MYDIKLLWGFLLFRKVSEKSHNSTKNSFCPICWKKTKSSCKGIKHIFNLPLSTETELGKLNFREIRQNLKIKIILCAVKNAGKVRCFLEHVHVTREKGGNTLIRWTHGQNIKSFLRITDFPRRSYSVSMWRRQRRSVQRNLSFLTFSLVDYSKKVTSITRIIKSFALNRVFHTPLTKYVYWKLSYV